MYYTQIMNCGNNRFTVWFCVMQMTISIRSLLFVMPFYSHILWNCVIRKWFILETTFCHDVQCLFCANDHSNKFFIICLAILITCTYLNMVALHVSLKFSGKNLSKLWTHKKKATNMDTERTARRTKRFSVETQCFTCGSSKLLF